MEKINMNNELRESIKETITTSIRKFFEGKKVKTKNMLDMIFPVERRIRSLIGGLETSFGTTVWEPLAKEVSKFYGFEVCERIIPEPTPMPEDLAKLITDLRNLRDHKETWIPMKECKSKLAVECIKYSGFDFEYNNPPPGKGVDVYALRDGIEWVFDIKTVQSNVRSGLSYNQQLLEWYAWRYLMDPRTNINAFIAFPYNPYSGDYWEKEHNKAYPLEPAVDALVADEFWGLLSDGHVTMDDIWGVFRELGESNFGDEFKDIFYI